MHECYLLDIAGSAIAKLWGSGIRPGLGAVGSGSSKGDGPLTWKPKWRLHA